MAKLHEVGVLRNRFRILARHLADFLPASGSVLDVGCGNGVIAQSIMQISPGLEISGIDVKRRPACTIPCEVYDGHRIPRDEDSVDLVLFVDVLHHVEQPQELLLEARRVARRAIIVKDHFCDSRSARRILSFMDWVGNRPHGVVLPYNYFSSAQWDASWNELGVSPDRMLTRLGMYPKVLRPLFETGLHFVCRLPLAKPDQQI
jgi:SAM-dependent methyltransferase